MMKKTGTLAALALAAALLIINCGQYNQSQQGPGAKIAQVYGIDRFSDIGKLAYTFNSAAGDTIIQRQWTWEPGTGDITFKGIGPSGDSLEYSYNQNDLQRGDEVMNKKIDSMFIGDQYWLLFPFHLVWDSHVKIKSDTITPLPIPPGEARRLVVTYETKAPHMAGDVFELFYGPDYIIKQWIYHQGGAEKPTRITTWQQYVNLGSITAALDHEGKDNTFRQWFTDVAVKYQGGGEWVKPVAIAP